MLIDDRRCIPKKIHFTDRDDVIVIQCYIGQEINLTKIIGKIELKRELDQRKKTKKHIDGITLVLKTRERLPMVVRIVSFCRARCSAVVQWN